MAPCALGLSFSLDFRVDAIRILVVIVDFKVANSSLSVCHGHINSGHVSKHLKLTLRFDRIIQGRRCLVALE
jgi:hypothetical protein